MKSLIITSGLPASGKTTLNRLIAQELRKKDIRSIVHFTTDDFRDLIFDNPGIDRDFTEAELAIVYNGLKTVIKTMIETNSDSFVVMFDGVFRSHKQRHSLIEYARDVGIENIILIQTKCDLETNLSRAILRHRQGLGASQHVLLSVIEAYEQPDPAYISSVGGKYFVVDTTKAEEEIRRKIKNQILYAI